MEYQNPAFLTSPNILLPRTPESLETFNKVSNELLVSYGEKVAFTFDPVCCKYIVTITEGSKFSRFSIQLYDCGTSYGADMFERDGEKQLQSRFFTALKQALTSGIVVSAPATKRHEVPGLPPMSSEVFAEASKSLFQSLNSPFGKMEDQAIDSVYIVLEQKCTQTAAMSYPKLAECILCKLDPSHNLSIAGRISTVKTLQTLAQHPIGRTTLAKVFAECGEVEQWPLWISGYLTLPYSVHGFAPDATVQADPRLLASLLERFEPSKIQLETTLLRRALIDLLKDVESMIVRADYLETIQAAIKGLAERAD